MSLFGFSPAVGTALLLPAVGTAFLSWVLGPHPWLFFLCRPSIPCSFVHISPVAGCDEVAVSCSQHVLHTSSLASFLTGSLSPFLPSSAATSGYFSVLLARVADFFFSFWADSWFRLVRVPALVGFFWPDCDFLVVIVPVASLSRIFVRHFSSVLLLQLHLVVVYSDVAAGAHSSTAV